MRRMIFAPDVCIKPRRFHQAALVSLPLNYQPKGPMVFGCPVQPSLAGVGTASAQTIQSGYPATKAIDGLMSGSYWYWSAGGAAPKWWLLDLGNNYNITQIAWVPAENATYVYTYDVQVSFDNSTWITLESYVDEPSGVWHSINKGCLARYVKFNFTASSGGYQGWISIAEVMISGDPA